MRRVSGRRVSGLAVMMAIAFCGSGLGFAAPAETVKVVPEMVKVVPHVAERRVDITVDGRSFTSYIWPATIKKPVLFPIVDADGMTLTRGYPLAPRAGERTDHPHHEGLWFNYSNVNGYDFWNNSDAIPASREPKMGSIRFDKIVSSSSGAHRGELITESTWIDGSGQPLIAETTRFVFASRNGVRSVERTATLRALDTAVFHDDKDGLLGLRVASWLESPNAKGGSFTDGNGQITKVSGASPDASGVYLTSDGVKGEAAWGTRGRWCALTGHTGDHAATIAIFDHPGNPGYPTYWHARDYGLFAANPLGRDNFDRKQPAFNYTLRKGETATFRYLVVFYPRAATAEELNRAADAFAGSKHGADERAGK